MIKYREKKVLIEFKSAWKLKVEKTSRKKQYSKIVTI